MNPQERIQDGMRKLQDDALSAGGVIFRAMAASGLDAFQIFGKLPTGQQGLLVCVAASKEDVDDLKQLVHAWTTQRRMHAGARLLNGGEGN